MMVPTTTHSTNVRLLIVSTLLAAAALIDAKKANRDDDIEESSRPPPCDSPIYCYGDILHTVQTNSIYTDSKTFVDMKMRNPQNKTLLLFEEFMNSTGHAPTKTEIEVFVNNTFEAAGSEFEDWDPSDWTEHPKFLDNILDPNLNKFASSLNEIWKLLGRKMKDEVKENEDLYSIIYVPNPVIVPGGRFREFYYWDSYWIVRGLLRSEMHTTVRGMLSNFVSVVERIGFIPNGGRVYYKMRSQPPMLIPMVKAYLDVTNDLDWLTENVWLLEKEFQFWMNNHTVTFEKDGVSYTMARYYEISSGPRPESYREDYESAQYFRTDAEKNLFYRELKAGAESGWDFSSRWFISESYTNKGNLTSIKTSHIIPVCLNSILYGNAVLLSEFYTQVGNATKAAEYASIAEQWQKAVTAVLWHDEVGAWLDYDFVNEVKRDYFYPTNIAPFWTHCYDPANRENHVAKILKYLEKSQIMIHLGGIPATLEHSGEQWDYPNAWAPLQWIMIRALNNTEDPWAQRLAYEISQRWVRSNWLAFNETGYMFEKYDATVAGGHGGGGEYEVQLGFGWSNGAAMELMYRYGDKLTAEDYFTPNDVSSSAFEQQVVVSSTGQLLTGILVLIISLATGFIGMVVYKSRNYYAPAPSTMTNKKGTNPATSGSLYRKRVAYTELKDLNYD
ncbi:trehalase isoform X1 [Neodiprion lecontei]|uniref:Trehalase n=2 Tax=Neodiprion lecontei TaxID=441921 RepID=A0A6J0BH40_NEOLC|nr:trehalase isoform X1 [Neodiprion lecontei]XP_015513507.1 trehalase isoform X1 [Neodiprion lecontei]XP_046597418.1 trehalase isoform X1 [Neodiprion lecontei]